MIFFRWTELLFIHVFLTPIVERAAPILGPDARDGFAQMASRTCPFRTRVNRNNKLAAPILGIFDMLYFAHKNQVEFGEKQA